MTKTLNNMDKSQRKFLYMRITSLNIKEIVAQLVHYMFLNIVIILN